MQMKRVVEAEEYQVVQESITFTSPINTEIHNLVYICLYFELYGNICRDCRVAEMHRVNLTALLGRMTTLRVAYQLKVGDSYDY